MKTSGQYSSSAPKWILDDIYFLPLTWVHPLIGKNIRKRILCVCQWRVRSEWGYRPLVLKSGLTGSTPKSKLSKIEFFTLVPKTLFFALTDLWVLKRTGDITIMLYNVIATNDQSPLWLQSGTVTLHMRWRGMLSHELVLSGLIYHEFQDALTTCRMNELIMFSEV